MDLPGCQFCSLINSHSNECPTTDEDSDIAVQDWRDGYSTGFEDVFIPPIELHRNRSKWFRLGYKKGKMEIDRAVDDAYQWQYSFHNGEY